MKLFARGLFLSPVRLLFYPTAELNELTDEETLTECIARAKYEVRRARAPEDAVACAKLQQFLALVCVIVRAQEHTTTTAVEFRCSLIPFYAAAYDIDEAPDPELLADWLAESADSLTPTPHDTRRERAEYTLYWLELWQQRHAALAERAWWQVA